LYHPAKRDNFLRCVLHVLNLLLIRIAGTSPAVSNIRRNWCKLTVPTVSIYTRGRDVLKFSIFRIFLCYPFQRVVPCSECCHISGFHRAV